jgi:hypothetical protein
VTNAASSTKLYAVKQTRKQFNFFFKSRTLGVGSRKRAMVVRKRVFFCLFYCFSFSFFRLQFKRDMTRCTRHVLRSNARARKETCNIGDFAHRNALKRVRVRGASSAQLAILASL